MIEKEDNTYTTSGSFMGHYKKRSDVHLARKIWHITTVFLMFVAWMVLPFWLSLTLLVMGWLSFVPADFVCLKNPELNTKLTRMFRLIMRENELDRLAGTTYLISGAILIVCLFSKPVVALSLLFLAFADPIASYVGIRWGRDKIFGHKSVQGFIAAYVVCSTLSGLFLYFNNIEQHIVIVSLIAGLVGALAELVPIAKIDDNFTMPVLSSVGLFIVFYLFGITQLL